MTVPLPLPMPLQLDLPDAAPRWPATMAAARAAIAAVRPEAYARTRNDLAGAVTRLSPYITHGFVSLPEVLAGVAARHPLHVQHKLVYELGWRAYFRHVWQHRGPGILQSLHPGPLPEACYSHDVPADVRQARTGVPVIDQAVRTLYSTGYLHNHARLWLASYLVHLRKLHWRAGADWLLGHLLDGDLASNHLSWQWVAGTGSSKPYLFNADNVARYAPAHWHSAGSVVDRPYDALDRLARSPQAVPARPQGEGVDEPPRRWRRDTAASGHAGPASTVDAHGHDAAAVDLGADPGAAPLAALADQLAGRDVWLVHPFALGEPPADRGAGLLRLGWWPTEGGAAGPWSAQRWQFTGSRMAELTALRCLGTGAQLQAVLRQARQVHTQANGHVDPVLPGGVQAQPELRLFQPVATPCASFSAWWHRSTRGLQHLTDLPGLAQAGPPTEHPHLARHGA